MPDPLKLPRAKAWPVLVLTPFRSSETWVVPAAKFALKVPLPTTVRKSPSATQ